ncbi:phage integrase family protein [Paucimonas lemoignei]|uniref:Phage integrase family protein n=1 Tax=Paucimonas lemoignei TaxID=29443 RepID=A0A4R3HRB4_PAULE|nr:tyrosine-type recombinase/integrase [Paucimonas lemoignei]TCS35647.1 phage integrase family protein [Paucimonas lemoignei]
MTSRQDLSRPRAVKRQSPCLLASPIEATDDESGRLIPRPSRSTDLNAYCSRAAEFLTAFHRGDFHSGEPTTAAIASVIGLEGICSIDELKSLLAANNSMSRIGDQCAVSWKASDDHLDRRFLHPATTLALVQVDQQTTWPAALSAFDALLGRTRSTRTQGAAELGHLAGLLLDMTAWHFLSLHRPLFCHVARFAPASALPDSVYARRVAKRPLLLETSSDLTADDADRIQAQVIDTALQYNDAGSGGWVIAELKTIANLHKHKARALAKIDWIKSLGTMSGNLRDAGSAAATIFGWVLHMVTVGTPREASPSPATISAYVSAISSELLQELGAHKDPIPCWKLTDIIDAYQRILKCRASNLHAASALNAFHAYLVDSFDMPPLRQALASEVRSVHKANILWDHEADSIRDWLGSGHGEERLSQQVRLAFELAHHLHLRIGELFSLCLRSVRTYDDGQIELEIAPSPKGKSGKSPASRRIRRITSEETAQLLRRWVQRRDLEAALHDDYLFGDPHNGKRVYQYGKTYVMLSRALKAASGDTSISPHALRHGVSFEVEQALIVERHDIDINLLDEIAVETGHRSFQMGWGWYSHLFEQPLRDGIDRSLKNHELNYGVVAKLTGLSREVLRQRVARSPENRNCTLRKILQDSAGALPIPDICAKFNFTDLPESPDVFAKPGISFEKIVAVLGDISANLTLPAIAARNGIGETTIQDIAASALCILSRQYAAQIEWRKLLLEDPLFVLQNLQKLNIRSPFERAEQAKFLSLSRFLAGHVHTDVVTDGLRSWQACADGDYISLDSPNLAEGLIALLHGAGVPLTHLVLRAAPGFVPPMSAIDQVIGRTFHPGLSPAGFSLDLVYLFQKIYNGTPQIEAIVQRRGRPSAYLLVSSCPASGEDAVQNAAVGMAGFHGLMIAAHIFRDTVLQANATDERTRGED